MPAPAFHDVTVMRFNPTVGLTRLLGSREGRRAPGRLPQEQLASSLGPVIDLSTGGMRVLAKRPPPPTQTLTVRVVSGAVCLDLTCQVAWSRRLGFRRHEVGLTFVDVYEDLALMLSRISLDHRAKHAV
jgi:PilZ domain-containing protein